LDKHETGNILEWTSSGQTFPRRDDRQENFIDLYKHETGHILEWTKPRQTNPRQDARKDNPRLGQTRDWTNPRRE
jgi:hypothetical protein